MKQFFTIVTLICLATLPLPADTLVEISRVKIPLGRGDAQFGLEEGGGEYWKPLFFSIDNDANIHIPDFYKAHIAVFDKSGKLIKKIRALPGFPRQ